MPTTRRHAGAQPPRRRGPIWVLLFIGVLIGAVWFWRQYLRPERSPKSDYAANRSAGVQAVAGSAAIAPSNLPAQPAAGQLSAGTVGATTLRDLRSTYRPGGLPARIRLQGELSERWEKQPPTAAEVIGQIADTSAPDEHRVYVAQLFRNLAKMSRLAPKEAADVVDRMLGIVADGKDAPLVRGQLAVVVAGFDKSAEAVRTIAPLLDETNDNAGALAVTALRHTATDEAASKLYEYLQRDTANRESKPKTTASALLALTGYGKFDVAPIAKEIVTQTQSLELFQGALVSLSKAESSVAVVDAILTAYDQAGRLRGIEPVRVKEVSLRALRAHMRFIETPSSDSVLERARQVVTQARNRG